MAMRPAILLLLALCAACTDLRADREAALRPFVGQTEEQLVRALGVPTRSTEAGGHRFLAYSESRIDVIPGFPGLYPPFAPGPYFFGYGGGFPPEAVQRTCETTFEVAAGRVVGFALRGNACG